MLMKWFRGGMPDITPAQIIAFIIGAVPQILVLCEIDLSDAQDAAVNKLLFLAGGLFLSDADSRVGRNLGVGRLETYPDEPGHDDDLEG